MKNKEQHDKAWNFLDTKGLSIGEKMMVRSSFASMHQDEYPFIGIKYEKGEVKYYHSTYDEISSLMFETEEEVVLANAIYNITRDKFNMNDFMQQIKFTFRIILVHSKWGE